MDKEQLNLLETKNESWDIYQRLCNTQSMHEKCFQLECQNISSYLNNTLGILLTNSFSLVTGSAAEGTNITSEDYGEGLHSKTSCYTSDVDIMNVMCHVLVIDEGDASPERFNNYIYCQAERGEHTTDGFRKLRVMHIPENYSQELNMVIEHGFISSSKFMASTQSATVYSGLMESEKTGKNEICNVTLGYLLIKHQ